ncbi:metallophosphoesterase [Candidatus Poribacteria bacterium]|nr:metallophosphoesterase [Candidatus Poribacteria bacterium]
MIKKILSIALITFIFVILTESVHSDSPEYATGFVFMDSNHNGLMDQGEKGIEDVRVSNGLDIVKTDSEGKYKISIDDDTIIFVIKPKGWMTPLDKDNLPRFHYIHKPNGSPELKFAGVEPTGDLPESVDFPLYPNEEPDEFRVLLFGDTQPYSQEEINYLGHDVVEELVAIDVAFGMSLGDLVGDKLDLFDSLNKTTSLIGIPWYSIMGNHDMNYAAKSDKYADETFERVFGPPYYSFDYGSVHFIVLDDIIWNPEKRNYRGGLGEKQFEFVKNDLALLPKDQLVVLTMHIPLMELKELKELFQILEQHENTFSASAHYHHQEHIFFKEKHGWNGEKPHHHLINVTACGCWWKGAPDEFNIPHSMMMDGAPNGYSILTFDGNEYSIEYKAARRPADFQMSIFAPDEVSQDKTSETEVLVNVFAGNEYSKVSMSVGKNGDWIKMEKAEGMEDPYYAMMKAAEESPKPPKGKPLPNIKKCPHLWKANLPADVPKGKHFIHISTTDMFGQTYDGYRVIWIR